MPESATLISDEPRRHSDVEAWDKTDRPFRFPASQHARRRVKPGSSDPDRTQWLEKNDIHTQFLDAGIGCCWFAQQGDEEPVSGETEEEAIVRLARANGIELWRQA